MEHDSLAKTVAETPAIDPGAAHRAVRATPVSLGERISEGLAQHLPDMLSQLPREVRERLTAPATEAAGRR